MVSVQFGTKFKVQNVMTRLEVLPYHVILRDSWGNVILECWNERLCRAITTDQSRWHAAIHDFALLNNFLISVGGFEEPKFLAYTYINGEATR